MAEPTVTISDFKARCLRIMDEVDRTGVPVLVTRHGRPLARVIPHNPRPEQGLLSSASWADDDDLLSTGEPVWDAGQPVGTPEGA